MGSSADIHAIIYSYKGRDLYDTVKSVFETTDKGSVFITLIDQHQLDRSDKFSEFKDLEYIHHFWDKIDSPCNIKKGHIYDPQHSCQYVLLLSDSVTLCPGWSDNLKDFLNSKDVIISGKGRRSITYKDKYFFGYDEQFSQKISLSNLIDNNFIFAKLSTFKKIDYPHDVKYFGENEKIAMIAMEAGIEIFSASSDTYFQSNNNTLETLYVPFSIEHNYNLIFDMMEDIRYRSWVDYHRIDKSKIAKIPYQRDDVPYNPYSMKMVKAGQNRFIETVNSIF